MSVIPICTLPLPYLFTGDRQLDDAFRIALGDLIGNIIPFQEGMLTEPRPVVMAGLGYESPWTRDAAINAMNGTGLLFPDVTRHSLLAVLENVQGRVKIGGPYNQYWDGIIWAIGGWWYYLFTGDADFLARAYNATHNTLEYLEAAEFNARLNLFRGPACYGDGVAAYPDIYAQTEGSSSILDWPAANPTLVSTPGYGLPMHALSTNCVYYEVYRLLEKMAAALRLTADSPWQAKADRLKQAINHHFWSEAHGHYRYLVDPFGNCDYQEGLGHAFALLWGIADARQSALVLENQFIPPAGIPCVWPTFGRYELEKDKTFGRHSGTVWPHIQGFWGSAALAHGRPELFEFELQRLAHHACRDGHFAELYHPLTGERYGGVQEDRGIGIREWESYARQTWSATAFLRLVLMDLIGLKFEPEHLCLKPHVPAALKRIELRCLPYRQMKLDIVIEGSGDKVSRCRVNGRSLSEPVLSGSESGQQKIEIEMSTSP